MHSQTQWTPSAANKRRAEKRKSTHYSNVSAVAFAAVLLAILMLWIGQPITHPKGSVDMARAYNAHSEPGANRDDAMIIAVARDGRIYFNGSQVEIGDIRKQISDSVQAGSERKVYVRPDARCKNGDVEAMLREIQQAGITNIAILTEKVKLPGPVVP
jgi:biopolymer transport protein TolR